jgi:hypothetical protein
MKSTLTLDSQESALPDLTAIQAFIDG